MQKSIVTAHEESSNVFSCPETLIFRAFFNFSGKKEFFSFEGGQEEITDKNDFFQSFAVG